MTVGIANGMISMKLMRVFHSTFRSLTTNTMELIDSTIVNNNKRIGETLSSIQSEFIALQNEMLSRKKKQLRQENAHLLNQVEAAKAELIALELKNGKKQIPVPGARAYCTIAQDQTVSNPHKEVEPNVDGNQQMNEGKSKKPKKEKTVKAASDKAAGGQATSGELPVDVGRLDMRVGKIVEVGRHPDADSLYLEKIDCGEPAPRTVVSGLVKFIPLEEMQNRMVIVLCNLKPAKMRGVTSEAMVMCASSPDKVEILSPPPGALPGDLVHCEGYTRQPDAQLNPKKKIFETCAPDLMTNNELIACFKGSPLFVPEKGNIVAQTLKNVNVK